MKRIPSLILTSILTASVASAQDSAGVIELDDYVVYGEKPPKSLQDVAASVNLTSDKEIEAFTMQSYDDVFRLAGNVSDAAFVDGGFIIRGINSDGVGGVSEGAPLAALYIDGVAQTLQGARRGATQLWDVEQVEIFRGPQSTLTGRNTLAGAIYMKTKDPTFTPEGAFRAGFGEYDYREAAAAYSTPVNDKFALRLAASWERMDSTISYPNWQAYDQGDRYPFGEESYQIRFKTLYQPAGESGLRLLTGYSYSYQSSAITDALGTAYDPNVSSVFDRVWAGFGYISDTAFQARANKVHNFFVDGSIALGENWQITAIGAFTDSTLERPSIAGAGVQDSEILQQELSFEVRANYESERLTAVIGALAVSIQNDNWSDGPIRDYGAGLFTGRRRFLSYQDMGNYGIFGEINYDLTDRLTLVAGGRFELDDGDRTQITQDGQSYSGAPEDFRITEPFDLMSETSQTFGFDQSEFLPKVGLIFQLHEDHSVAFTVQQGFRAGGAGYNTGANETYTYDPEYTWNYELSFRHFFLDRRLSLRTNIFYTDWEDMQVPYSGPIGSQIGLTVNAGQAELYGGEVELQFRPVEGLSLFASLGYVHTEFKDFQTTGGQDYAGARFPEAPEWDVGFGMSYAHENGLLASVDYSYTGDYYSQILWWPQVDDTIAGDYGVLNFSVGYRWSNHWTVRAFVDNALDDNYVLYNEPFGDDAATLGMPRTWSLRLQYDF